ncbi:MAG: ABC transporter substrate-binding protein [Pseudomonas stutzeri]|uniref:substrate-binding periplasmic protein n=1 Tax=Stutzerimonas stutzeri TaxID=316 RepID=UPI0002DBBA47|nr:ABC transporter substrate-binding protein [Stutzerimonas stutzeri]MBO0640592.1 ABC transporter substrate-binding protein [Stutzerimonas stutzeri]MDH0118396.1 ABC transporter substrate-binding protein [Stutzerimonas stutzeri]MDH1540908.1 ABC transporter substrate-binding protein [Stutzerimonas stutzeri]MTI89919.1 ABC transporter substrate-binding protein [Stutzerimonas stutzeri]OCX58901.1 amino acid ABC transporter substrate-binding protein [Stutzerimonas stutzeri]
MARSRTARALFALLVSAAFSVRAELPASYPITLQTDSFPPFNMGPNSKGFARGDDVQGIAADTVRDIFRRAGVSYNLTLRGPWSRLYEQTQQQPAHGLFSVARTPQNAGQFKWVGPLAHHDSVLLAPAGKGLKFDSLAQAQGYQIGGHANGTVSLFLESQGIRTSNSLNDAENLRKLLTGRIDLWAVADPVWRYFARQQGVEEGQLQVALSFRSEPLYLALSPDTPDAVVNRLQKALDEVIAEGYAGCSKTPDLCYLIQNRGKTLAGSR